MSVEEVQEERAETDIALQALGENQRTDFCPYFSSQTDSYVQAQH